MNLMPIKQAYSNKNKLLFIMGEPKSGKTSFVNTCLNNQQRGLYIEVGIDNGWAVLDKNKNFDVIAAQTRTDNNGDAGIKLLTMLREINANQEQYAHYDFIIIDPINNVQDEVRVGIEKAMGRQMTQQEWGIINQTFIDIQTEVVHLLNIAHVIMLSHIKTLMIEDKFTGISSTNVIPLMTENNGKIFTKVADLVGITHIVKDQNGIGHHAITIGASPIVCTGVRNGNGEHVPSTPLKPDYQIIKKYLN